MQHVLGSSLSLPAHGWVGARATSLFPAAHFAKQNTNPVGVQSEGEAEGGCGGIRQLANRFARAESEAPAALLVQSRTQQKSFLFPFTCPPKPRRRRGRKNRARANQKMRRKLFCGGGAKRQFRSKKFRAKFRISHITILPQNNESSYWWCLLEKVRTHFRQNPD